MVWANIMTDSNTDKVTARDELTEQYSHWDHILRCDVDTAAREQRLHQTVLQQGNSNNPGQHKHFEEQQNICRVLGVCILTVSLYVFFHSAFVLQSCCHFRH